MGFVNQVALWQVSSQSFGFPLSISVHQCCIITWLHRTVWPKAWKSLKKKKKQISVGHRWALNKQNFHIVWSLVLTMAENALWGKTTRSFPPRTPKITLNFHVTTVCISMISPSCTIELHQFVYPWQATLHFRVTPVCISVTSHPALSGHTSLYIRDKQSYSFGSHKFRLGNKVTACIPDNYYFFSLRYLQSASMKL
jgi:hypothetical protein